MAELNLGDEFETLANDTSWGWVMLHPGNGKSVELDPNLRRAQHHDVKRRVEETNG